MHKVLKDFEGVIHGHASIPLFLTLRFRDIASFQTNFDFHFFAHAFSKHLGSS